VQIPQETAKSASKMTNAPCLQTKKKRREIGWILTPDSKNLDLQPKKEWAPLKSTANILGGKSGAGAASPSFNLYHKTALLKQWYFSKYKSNLLLRNWGRRMGNQGFVMIGSCTTPTWQNNQMQNILEIRTFYEQRQSR